MRYAAVLLVTALAPGAASAASAQYQFAGGTAYLQATEIRGIGESNKIVLDGSAHLKIAAKTGTAFESRSTDITIQLIPVEKNGKVVGNDIKSIEFVGPVKMTYDRPRELVDESGKKTTAMSRMEATADNARYDGATMMAYLTGNVKMTQTDPTMDAAAEAESVEINMKPNPGPEELVYRMTTPGGVSKLQITPKEEIETQ